jgi:three-Cys-motif partner protein
VTANEGFFDSLEPPAVLKHGILRRYPDVFSSAAGGVTGRVVLLDGYAGRGRYNDGAPGSPILLLDTAARLGSFRRVECVFVELQPENYEVLKQAVEEHGGETRRVSLLGDLSDHLPEIMRSANEAALFAFLDPFGTALDYDELVSVFFGRAKYPATEVLLHFSVGAIRRTAGLLRARASELNEADRKTIARADRFLGGDWWHEVALQMTDQPKVATRVAEKVAADYCGRICAATGCLAMSYPVRSQPDHEPAYYLTLFTRHTYGLWRFNDSLSKAHVEWQEAWRGKANARSLTKAEVERERAREAREAGGVMSLFDDVLGWEEAPLVLDQVPPYNENAEAAQWVDEIEGNLRLLLQQGQSFRLSDRIGEVYGSVLGLAREPHVGRALKRLHAAGFSDTDGVGTKLARLVIGPGPRLKEIEHTRETQ